MVLFGCGGHARSILNTLYNNGYNESDIVLVDENARLLEKVLGSVCVKEYELSEEDEYIIALGNNLQRKYMFEKKKDSVAKCINVIANNSSIGVDSKIGYGVYIAMNAYIGPSVVIGDNCIINTGCIVEHEVQVGSHTHLAPNSTICGRTIIGQNVFLGANSTIIDNIVICDNVTIGAGSVVVRDISEAGVYIGIPAKKIK